MMIIITFYNFTVLEEGSMPNVLAINVSEFTTSLYIAVEEL